MPDDTNSEGLTIWQELTDQLMMVMEDAFGDKEMWAAVRPVIPIIAMLAVDESLDLAMETLEGLAGEQSYEHWQRVIAKADHDTRLKIMDEANQMAIQDNLRRIAADERRAEAWKIGVKVALALLPVLL